MCDAGAGLLAFWLEPQQRHASRFFLIALPLNGAKLQSQASALTFFGVSITMLHSFGPPATQLALAVICVGTMALALVDGLRKQPVPVKCRSEHTEP